jgi:hypothetical protein
MILFSANGFTFDTLTNPEARDYSQRPFAALAKALNLVTPDIWDGSPVDAFIAWDKPPADIYRRVGNVPKILVAFEPSVVHPSNWDTALHDLFDAIITWHDGWAWGERYHKLYFPLPAEYPPLNVLPFSERRLLTHMSTNKYSSQPGELYSLRLHLLNWFYTNAPQDLRYYGMAWPPDEPCYGGTPTHKADVFPQHKFALVIENEAAPGWITEKLYDCLRCGVVPIYYGAPNVARYIDPAAFINLRAYLPDRIPALLETLRAMDEPTWQAYRDAGAAVNLSRHMPDAFIQTFQKVLQTLHDPARQPV